MKVLLLTRTHILPHSCILFTLFVAKTQLTIKPDNLFMATLKSYYYNRCIRVLPIYYICLVFTHYLNNLTLLITYLHLRIRP